VSVRFDKELRVNTKTLSLVIGIAAIAVAGCHLNTADSDPTACAGYIGCSGHTDKSLGIAPQHVDDGGTADASLQQINLGCGQAPPAKQAYGVKDKPTGYTQYSVVGTGATLTGTIASKKGPRTFWVRIPADYSPDHKYRTVYLGQGCGGYNAANTATYQLFNTKLGGTDEAIYVALDIPMDMANQDCYDNRDGPASQEWEAFQLIHSFVDASFCVDNDRIFYAGYSTGGWLASMWGCYFAGDGEAPWNGKVPQSGSVSGTQLTSRAGSIDGGGRDADVSDASSTGGAGTTGAAGTMGGGGAAGTAGVTGAAGTTGDGAAGLGGEGAAGTVGSIPYVPSAGARKFAPQYHIRAQAAVSGGEPDNNPPCNGPIAAIWLHDVNDSNAYTANHTLSLGRVLKMNGCYSNNPKTVPWHETELGKGVCVQYTDCPADYPVVFCTTSGLGHQAQPEKAVPGFSIFFNELESSFKTPVNKP
jgi:poly(3-hydroxybutyrate) depolymerase